MPASFCLPFMYPFLMFHPVSLSLFSRKGAVLAKMDEEMSLHDGLGSVEETTNPSLAVLAHQGESLEGLENREGGGNSSIEDGTMESILPLKDGKNLEPVAKHRVMLVSLSPVLFSL